MTATFPMRQPAWLTLCFLTLFISGCASFQQERVETSPNDPREYRHLFLDNKLEVLLISDPATDKAAAAMDVHVGSRDDPKEYQGLAHFLEHMLFLGTETYPEAGEYQSFITQHGGSHNAYTSYENTNYFFDVQPEFLEPALDRFSQQFVAPLFSAEYVQREKNAVHSEFTSGLRDDSRRFFAALKEVINPAHPFSGFSVGNLETLADREDQSVRDAMLDFYERHYSANKMRLVVYGKQNLDTLEQWVKNKFSAVPNRDLPKTQVNVPLIEPDKLPALLTVEPVMDQRTLSLMFPLPSIKPHYRSKPEYYLTNLIGHEGEGSLLAWLKERGWANSLSAGMALNNDEESALSVTISLTQDGLKNYQQVIQSTFQYIDLIRQDGIDEWRFDEQARLLDIDFRFQERADPIHYVSFLASRMRDYDARDVITAPYQMDSYDPKLYRDLLARLTPDNVLIALTAKGVATDQESQWYQTPFGFRPLTGTERRAIAPSSPVAEMHMPEPNPFIPESLDMIDEPDMSRPARLPTDKKIQAWHALDTSFGTPRANFYVSVRSPYANSSPRESVLTELFVRLADDALNTYTYPASLAGLDYRIYKHIRGFTFRLQGYNDKQLDFLKDVLEQLTTLEPAKERFDIASDNLRRQLLNAQLYRPYERTLSAVRKLLMDPYWTEDEQLQALEQVTFEDLKEFIPQLLSKMTTITLAHGNITEEEALALNQEVFRRLSGPAELIPVERSDVVSLTPGSNWYQSKQLDHRDTGFTWYMQGRDKDYRTRAQYGLLAQLMSASYYHDIRTQQQLGYVVFATPMSMLEFPGLAFIVQSPSASPEQLLTASQSFLKDFSGELAELPNQVYEQHRQALIANLLQQPTTLTEKSERYWLGIDEMNYNFDTREQIAAAVATLEKQELLQFYNAEILNQPTSLLTFSLSRGRSAEEQSSWAPQGFQPVTSKIELIKHNGVFPAH